MYFKIIKRINFKHLETFLIIITGRLGSLTIWWIEARDVTKHLILLMMVFRAKNYPALSVSNAEAEKCEYSR
jgi:hypothetical protein